MPRLVVPADPGKGRVAAKTVANASADQYKDRLVKYIPAESIALYTVADKFLIGYYGINAAGNATRVPADAVLTCAPWLLVLLGVVGTPIYLYRQRLPGQPWGLHAVIATVAFLFWVYTLGGSVVLINHWYHVVVAGLAAPIFTFVAGWFEPKPT